MGEKKRTFADVFADAIDDQMARDRKFTGTAYALSKRCARNGRGRVSPAMIENLLSGQTKPWAVRVATMQELVRALTKLRVTDFYRPAA